MKNKSRPITSTEAKRSLHALDMLSGKIIEPPKPRGKPIQREAAIQTALFKWAAASAAKHPELELLMFVCRLPAGSITGYIWSLKANADGFKIIKRHGSQR